MKILPAAIACALALSIPLLASPPRAEPQGPDFTPRVLVNGDATIYVAPDRAQVGFGIETFDGSLDVAKSQFDTAAKDLIEALQKAGIEEGAIEVDLLEVQRDYRRDEVPSTIHGYSVRRGYTVTLKDVTRFESVVDTALHHGANRVLGFEFYCTELRKHRDAARKLATRAAREKAELLAAELDAKVGKAISINEGWNRFYPAHRSWGEWSSGWNTRSQNSVDEGDESARARGAPTGQIAISAGVMVSFELVR